MDQGLEQTFQQMGIQIANRHTNICSILLAISKMQIKTMMRYHDISIGMATIKNPDVLSADKDAEKVDH